MQVGFFSIHDPYDRNAFSGTAFAMRAALEAAPGIGLRVLGGHRPRGRLARACARLAGGAGRARVDAAEAAGLDWILSLVSSREVPALAAAGPPVIHLTDATPGFLADFYARPVAPERFDIEARAIAAAARVVYSSRHMAERAAREFGPAAAAKAVAIPFGANFDAPPAAPPDKPALAPLRLLFVGKDWARKGGDTALAAMDALAAAGVAAELTVAGCDPEAARGRADVRVMGFLDKNAPRDAARLAEAFARAHLLLLPTRADCTPMVIAEANAHATPVLVTETGGIPSLMDAGVNGRMLPAEADGAAWAAAVRAICADPATHARFARGAFAHYRARLDWSAWARDMTALLAGAAESAA